MLTNTVRCYLQMICRLQYDAAAKIGIPTNNAIGRKLPYCFTEPLLHVAMSMLQPFHAQQQMFSPSSSQPSSVAQEAM